VIENGMADAFRPLVVVSATPATQVQRAAARDQATQDEARARVLAQMPLADKVKVADIVIDNDGTEAELLEKAKDALRDVCVKASVDPSRYGLSPANSSRA
jgi:dephospho-CoA kinase